MTNRSSSNTAGGQSPYPYPPKLCPPLPRPAAQDTAVYTQVAALHPSKFSSAAWNGRDSHEHYFVAPLDRFSCSCIFFTNISLQISIHKYREHQAFRCMVGPGHCPMISKKYGPSLSKAVGPEDPSFLVVKKSHLYKKYSSYCVSMNST